MDNFYELLKFFNVFIKVLILIQYFPSKVMSVTLLTSCIYLSIFQTLLKILKFLSVEIKVSKFIFDNNSYLGLFTSFYQNKENNMCVYAYNRVVIFYIFIDKVNMEVFFSFYYLESLFLKLFRSVSVQ